MQISRKFSFSAAHQIEGHPKCGRIHGHNYEVEVALFGNVNQETGMIMDFGDVDKLVKPMLDMLDHRYLVSRSNIVCNNPFANLAMMTGQDCMLTIEFSTAECIAEYLAKRIYESLDVNMVGITLWETPKSFACCWFPNHNAQV